ncbi:hypothetical protein GM415_15545 [Pseudodesulfovibrio cashew]|uniref:Uncharacterized protein n=1 Tax=Pseudodesulfovibrio cashew TaxID=2678688 RepID=A0A6I6JKF9_9BACT|nr:hypothetical protein [Pseudodesulfovibrio cashew]QGY41470.1 hypothetical protein GM415_15545 [Pseudodesulfovibrio cashew]
MAVSLDKDWTRVNLTICAETRDRLESWKQNGISLPAALATCARLVYADGMSPLHTPRGDIERVTFQLPVHVLAIIDLLAERWKVSRSEAADRILQIGAEAVETGANTQMSVIMPFEKEKV